jgi:hypothetical protein
MQHFHNGSEEDNSYAIIEESYAIYDVGLRRVSLLIHEYAEVAFKEYQSAETLAHFLEGEGFIVERGIAGHPTAFVGKWTQGKGPVVSFNAVCMPLITDSNIRNTMLFQVLDMPVGTI